MGAERGPVVAHGRFVVKLPALGQQVDTRGGHALAGRRGGEQCLAVDVVACPGVDDQFAFDIGGDLEAELGSIVNKTLQLGADVRAGHQVVRQSLMAVNTDGL